MNRVRNGRAGASATALAMSVFVGVLAGATSAAAQGADDHATAQALVKQLEQDAAHRAVTAEAAAQAKDALERATRLRTAGDEAHAKAADGLAREWAETGRDLARAVDAETKAGELRRKAVDAQAQLERSRTLLEEGIARVGRLNAQIDEADRSAHPAVEVHDRKPAASGAEPTASADGAGSTTAAHPAKGAGTGKGDGSGKGNGTGKSDGSGQPKPGKKTAGGAP